MQDIANQYWKHARIALALLRGATGWVPTLVGAGALIAALLIVPDENPHAGDWFGLLLIAALGGFAVLASVARLNRHLPEQAQTGLNNLALLSLVIGALLNIWFGWAAVLAFLVGVGVFALVAIRSRTAQVPSGILTGVVALMVPIWCWIALGATEVGLLLLVPLLILGWLADRYMIGALKLTAAGEARSYRFLSWLCLLFGCALCSLLPITSDVANSWAVLGTIGALICIGVDLGLPEHASQPGRWSRMLMAAGFGWLGLFWLTSL